MPLNFNVSKPPKRTIVSSYSDFLKSVFFCLLFCSLGYVFLSFSQGYCSKFKKTKCRPCPAHAECINGEVVCHENYVLQGFFKTCVPDTQKRVNVDSLLEETLDKIRFLVGVKKCTFTNEYLTWDEVERIVQDVVKTHDWMNHKVYSAMALTELFATSIENVVVDGKLLTVLNPKVPLTCFFKDFIQRQKIKLIIALCVLCFILVMFKFDKHRQWRQEQAKNIEIEIIKILKKNSKFVGIDNLKHQFHKFYPKYFDEIWTLTEILCSKNPEIRTVQNIHHGSRIKSWEFVGFEY